MFSKNSQSVCRALIHWSKFTTSLDVINKFIVGVTYSMLSKKFIACMQSTRLLVKIYNIRETYSMLFKNFIVSVSYLMFSKNSQSVCRAPVCWSKYATSVKLIVCYQKIHSRCKLFDVLNKSWSFVTGRNKGKGDLHSSKAQPV